MGCTGFGQADIDHATLWRALPGLSADVTVDGERIALGVGQLLRVAPSARRRMEPGPDGVRILAIGCAAGGAYARPEGFELAAAS